MRAILLASLLTGCAHVIGPGINIVETPIAAIRCGGSPACAAYNNVGCTVYVPKGWGELYLRLTAWIGPEVALAHEIRHCFEGDFHHPLFWFIDKESKAP